MCSVNFKVHLSSHSLTLVSAFFLCLSGHNLVFFPSFTGNIRLHFLFERNPWEVSDSYKLPSPSPPLPSDWRAAQPSHTEGGRTQPLWGPFCSGPYGRLMVDIPLPHGNSFSSDTHPHPSFFFLRLSNGHYAQGIIYIKVKPPCIQSLFGCVYRVPISLESLEFYQINISWSPSLNSSLYSCGQIRLFSIVSTSYQLILVLPHPQLLQQINNLLKQ